MLYSLIRPYVQDSAEKSFKRGEIIYHQGDNPENLFGIETGLVGLFHLSENGKETFWRVFGKDNIFGHRSYFAEETYHGTSMALAPCRVNIIPKAECQRICDAHPELVREVTKRLARDLRVSELRLAALQDKSANLRIVEALVFLKLKYPNHVWTRREIAEYSCSALETVTRVMTQLEKMDLLEKVGRDFLLPDVDQVLELSPEDFSG